MKVVSDRCLPKQTRAYRAGRVPVTELRYVAYHEDTLARDLQYSKFDRSARPQKLIVLTSPGVVVATSENKTDTWLAAHCTYMHRNRLPRTDGNRQAAIAPDR